MAKIVTLKNSNDETIYPTTVLSAVNGAIGTGRIDDQAVTAAKIQDSTITQDKFDLDEFPAGHYGAYFTSNITTTNSSTGADLGSTTIANSKTVRIMFEFSARMMTSRYTSNVCLKVDGTVVASSGTNSTSYATIIGRHVMTLEPGTHTVAVAIRSQDSGTTATAIAYTSETNGFAWWCV